MNKIEEKDIELLKKENKTLCKKVSELEHQVENFQKLFFGKKSEKMKNFKINDIENQLSLFEDYEELSSNELEDYCSNKSPIKETIFPQIESKKGRTKISKEIPVVEFLCSIPENERVSETGEELVVIGYEESSKLHYIPEKLVRLLYRREILGYKDSREYVKMAPLPEMIIQRGKFSDDLIHNFVFEKYFNGMPLYRQIKSLSGLGIDIAKSTVSDSIKKFSEFYTPIYNEIKKQIFESKFIHADESPLKYGGYKEKYKNGFIFVYQDKNQVYFHYGDNKSQTEIQNVLTPVSGDDESFLGFLMCDGYAGYNKHKGKRLACFAHGRRNFFKLAPKSSDSKSILDLINSLYYLEKEIHQFGKDNSLTENEILEKIGKCRQTKSKTILETLRKRLIELDIKYTPKSLMGKAISYMLKRWNNYLIYLEDPILPLDNNAAERSIRSMVIGRKNYFFAGSKEAGKSSAICYSIMESCRLQGIDPREYIEKATIELLKLRKEKKPDYSKLTPINLSQNIRKMKSNF
jgi:transposase